MPLRDAQRHVGVDRFAQLVDFDGRFLRRAVDEYLDPGGFARAVVSQQQVIPLV